MNLPALHVLVPDEIAWRDDFKSVAAGMRGDLGPRLALHLRCRRATGAALFGLAGALSREADSEGGWCVVNGRVDVALAARCHALQLGSRAMPPRAVTDIVHGRCAVGVSVHSAADAARAADGGANFVIAGTVYPTASHPGRPGAGPVLVGECAAPGLPVVAIGGIDVIRARETVAHGAVGVAVISAVWGAPDPRVAAIALADAVEAASRGS